MAEFMSEYLVRILQKYFLASNMKGKNCEQMCGKINVWVSLKHCGNIADCAYVQRLIIRCAKLATYCVHIHSLVSIYHTIDT